MRDVPGCTGKAQYPSKSIARGVMTRMKPRSHVLPGERLSVYACQFCDYWHIGRSTADEREYLRFKARLHATAG